MVRLMIRSKNVKENWKHNFLTFFPKEKKGLMDDFTDLLSFALILFFIGIFAFMVLQTDAGDKASQTLDKVVSFRGQEALLDLVNAPVLFGDKEIVMKDAIISAVNANDEALFTEKMQAYFEQQQIEGSVAVYDSVSYGKEEVPEPLLSYHNIIFLGEEKGALYLTNIEGAGSKKLIVVKLFG